ncbi:hypothetical protein JCM11251_004859 [Rhodosporidiobolus azoricus]
MYGPSAYVEPYGLLSFNEHHHPTPIPLVKVDAKAIIIDLSSSIRLSQVYRNEGQHNIEASYVFPVPDRAAVNGFAMIKEDGTRIVGIVEEKAEARKQYDEAVEAGKLASLTEQATPDTFRCSVGNILPNETVTIELTYVTELTEGDTSDSIRFHLPSRVGARYGRPPTEFGYIRAGASVEETIPPSPFTVSVNIESAAPLAKISCPSHTVSTELGPDSSLPDASSLPFANYARVTFTSESSLERDFVLELSSPGLDSPRCLAEKHPTADSVAVSLTFVPRFKLPEVENQEFIFLVDRSGSMGGDRIAMAKKAMVVLLRSLPHKGTTFNIVSFGSDFKALWQTGSRAYNQATLDEATRLVDSMDANFGGTEMRNALDSVFKERKKDVPTSLFVLTDGDAWDLAGVNDSVKKAVSSSDVAAPLRVFVLGIGNSASTALCEGIARHGRGLAQFVVDGESFTGKCNRLLKAAKSPAILNARLDYAINEEAEDAEDFEVVEPEKESLVEKVVEKITKTVQSINLFDKDIDPLADEETEPAPEPEPVDLPPTSAVQQVPRKIYGIYPGSRIHTYAILSPASLLPSTVTLRGELASGQQVELEIPVTTSKLRTASTSSAPPPIHTLTARKVIQSLEDGDHDLASSIADGDLLSRTVMAHVVRLGKTYSLVSTHTSFVAIDESELRKPRRKIEIAAPPPPAPVLFGGAPGGGARFRTMARIAAPAPGGGGATLFAAAVPPPPPAPAPATAFAPMAATFAAIPSAPPTLRGGLFGSATPTSRAGMAVPSGQPSSFHAFGSTSSSSGGLFGGGRGGAPDAGAWGAAPSGSGWGGVPQKKMATPAPAGDGEAAEGGGGGSGSVTTAADALPFGSAPSAPSAPPDPSSLTPSDLLDALARLQAFDGSFSPSALPLCDSSRAALELAKKLPADLQDIEGVEQVVATLVVLAFWEREMKKEQEEWEEMASKGRGFVAMVAAKEGKEVEDLVRLGPAARASLVDFKLVEGEESRFLSHPSFSLARIELLANGAFELYRSQQTVSYTPEAPYRQLDSLAVLINMLLSLPNELVDRIIRHAIPAEYSSDTYGERQATLCDLCVVNRKMRNLAQPILEEVVKVSIGESLVPVKQPLKSALARKHLRVLALASGAVDIQDYAADLASLRDVRLCNMELTDVTWLERLPCLRNLVLYGCALTSTCFPRLALLATFTWYHTWYKMEIDSSSSPVPLTSTLLPSLRHLCLYMFPMRESQHSRLPVFPIETLTKLDTLILGGPSPYADFRELRAAVMGEVALGVDAGNMMMTMSRKGFRRIRFLRALEPSDAAYGIQGIITMLEDPCPSSIFELFLFPTVCRPAVDKPAVLNTAMHDLIRLCASRKITLDYEDPDESHGGCLLSPKFAEFAKSLKE